MRLVHVMNEVDVMAMQFINEVSRCHCGVGENHGGDRPTS